MSAEKKLDHFLFRLRDSQRATERKFYVDAAVVHIGSRPDSHVVLDPQVAAFDAVWLNFETRSTRPGEEGVFLGTNVGTHPLEVFGPQVQPIFSTLAPGALFFFHEGDTIQFDYGVTVCLEKVQWKETAAAAATTTRLDPDPTSSPVSNPTSALAFGEESTALLAILRTLASFDPSARARILQAAQALASGPLGLRDPS